MARQLEAQRQDKPKPAYYAQRTVTGAAASLRGEQSTTPFKTHNKEMHTMIQEALVDGEQVLLVHTEEEFQEAFGREETITILPATMELARKMGCPEQEEGHDPAEAEDIKQGF